jgi:hypothetical protein
MKVEKNGIDEIDGDLIESRQWRMGLGVILLDS